MTKLSRRDWGKLTAGLLSGTSFAQSSAGDAGVRLGACTYSFRDLPRANGDAIGPVLDALKKCRVNICELFSVQVEPENVALNKVLHDLTARADGKALSPDEARARYHAAMNGPEAKQFREKLREWRINTPMQHFNGVRQRFEAAGVDIFAYTVNFSNDFTGAELDGCFQQARALRAKAIAASTQLSMLPRLKPMAEKYELPVAVHGHSDTKHPDEFSSPETFQRALDMSPRFKVNLDIGHFTAAGFDAASYIDQHHDRVSHLHLKDRKKNDGPNEPFGEGDTPIKQVLQLLKRKR